MNWNVVSRATDHITSDLDKLSVKEKYHGKEQVQTASGSGMAIHNVGHSKLETSTIPLHINNILHVPQTNRNLLSVQKLAYDNNVYLEFYPNFFAIKDRTTKALLFKGKCQGGLYCFASSLAPHSNTAYASVKLSPKEWHSHLGHPSFSSFIVSSRPIIF